MRQTPRHLQGTPKTIFVCTCARVRRPTVHPTLDLLEASSNLSQDVPKLSHPTIAAQSLAHKLMQMRGASKLPTQQCFTCAFGCKDLCFAARVRLGLCPQKPFKSPLVHLPSSNLHLASCNFYQGVLGQPNWLLQPQPRQQRLDVPLPQHVPAPQVAENKYNANCNATQLSRK